MFTICDLTFLYPLSVRYPSLACRTSPPPPQYPRPPLTCVYPLPPAPFCKHTLRVDVSTVNPLISTKRRRGRGGRGLLFRSKRQKGPLSRRGDERNMPRGVVMHDFRRQYGRRPGRCLGDRATGAIWARQQYATDTDGPSHPAASQRRESLQRSRPGDPGT